MNINVLKYYIELYKQKNLNKAAANLFITPQGLSKAMTNLEKELGLQLIKHGNKHIQFTDDGDFFYRKAIELWDAYTKMIVEVQERSLSLSSSITLGIADGISKYLGTDFWDEFNTKHENIHLNIIEAADKQIEQMVNDETIDIGISSCAFDDTLFTGEKLFSIPIHLLCAKGHPLYSKEKISLKDLEGQTLITLSDQYKSPAFFRRVLSEKHIHVNMISASEMSYIWDLCYQKKGIALIPSHSFPFLSFLSTDSSTHNDPLFHEIPITNLEPNWEIFLIHKCSLPCSLPLQWLEHYIISHSQHLTFA